MKFLLIFLVIVSVQLEAKESKTTDVAKVANTTNESKDAKPNPKCKTLKSEQKSVNEKIEKTKKEGADLDKQIAGMNEAIDKQSKACKDSSGKNCNHQMLNFIGQQRMMTQGKKQAIENAMIALIEQQKENDRLAQECSKK